MREDLMACLGGLLWPTRKIVGFCKKKDDAAQVGKVLRAWSKWSFRIDVVLVAVLLLGTQTWGREPRLWSALIVGPLIWYSFSRVNEIVSAFWKDAIDRLKKDTPRSDLTNIERIEMAARSYAGLLVNFATLYCFIPIANGFEKPIDSYLSSLYFSGVTLATLGYGDIVPKHWLFRPLAVYEVLSGMLLVAVSFAVYVSAAQEPLKPPKDPA